jgi:D-amino peptidase
MDIYLYTDEEGVAGVDWWDNRESAHPEDAERRRRARELLMGEVNAAADGAYAGGAQRVLAVEGHKGSFRHELADARLELVTGAGYPVWLPELKPGFAGAMVVGAHAMFGTPGATLAHTFCFEEGRRWFLGDREIGEFGAFAAICGAHGVPVILAAGDDKLCAEARALVPGIEAVQVKTAIGLHCARHLSAERSRAALREGARRAVARAARGEVAPLRMPGPPYSCRALSGRQCPAVAVPGVEQRRISAGETEFSGADLLAVMQAVTSY